MKIRTSFVSNSSSSSFVVKKVNLSSEQINKIMNHAMWHQLRTGRMCDEWEIADNGDSLYCHTLQDNFSLKAFCTEILGIPEECLEESWHSS